MSSNTSDFDRYVAACDYPGVLDEAKVNESLTQYCAALGITRKVQRIDRPWWRNLQLLETVIGVARAVLDALAARDARAARAALDALAALDARDARDARAALDAGAALAARDARAALDALDARDARGDNGDWAVLLREFGNWVMARSSYWVWDFELSYIATTYFGAMQSNKSDVAKWSKPVLEAFCAGASTLFWTGDTLYWTAKPTVSVETGSFGRRLHCEDGPACTSDIENLYFIHGVMVPAYAVIEPSSISLAEIKSEENEEVRRILIERFGWERFIRESGAQQRHRRFNERDGQWEQLYRLEDGSQRVVLVDPSTTRKYALGCPRDINTCEEAQNFMSHGLDKLAIHRS